MTASPASWSRPAEPVVALAAAVGAVAVFLSSWAILHQGFYTRERIVDTPVYQKYGDWMAGGRVPYRDFRPEYPPAALPVFLVPSLIVGEGASSERYARVFEALMALCGAACVALAAFVLARLGAAPGRLLVALAFVAVAPLALGSVILSRFDLWPAALGVGAIAALVAGRDRLASGVVGVAVAAKLFPGVLVPLLAAWVWRRRGRREALVCGAVLLAALAACFLPFLALAPDGVAASLGRQLSRPLQIESLGASLLVVGHHVIGYPLEMKGSHGSQNVAGAPGVVVGILHTALQAAGLLVVWIRFARGPMERERLVRYAAAAVLAFVVLGKVLSPQFLIWLVPLVPLVRGRRGLAASALLALALVLTQVWFPFRYWDYARTFDVGVSWLVLARNGVLLAALAVLVWPATAALSPNRPAPARRRS